LAAAIDFERIPFIDAALQLAPLGFATGAAARNWDSYGAAVDLDANLAAWQRQLLCDPQTSGGLLVSCAPAAVEAVLAAFAADGFGRAAVIGHMQPGAARVMVG
jgi:selenide,water dikinase